MCALNKQHRVKQVTKTSIIISHTHAPPQLCIVALNCITVTGDHNYGATRQSCSGALV